MTEANIRVVLNIGFNLVPDGLFISVVQNCDDVAVIDSKDLVGFRIVNCK